MLLCSCTILIAAIISLSSARNLHSKKAKRVVFVLGADGLIGRTTVSTLSSMFGNTWDIKAGVKDPAKAKSLEKLPGVAVVKADLGQKERLMKVLKDVDALYIVGTGNDVSVRARLTVATAVAAKEVGVKHLLVYSLVAAEFPGTIFGGQYYEIETKIANLGVPYTILRLPILANNLQAHRSSIKHSSIILWPVDPDKPFTTVTAKDASAAAAVILASPEKHDGRTYTIVSDRVTYKKIARVFTKELGRSIQYVRVPYETTKSLLMKAGFSQVRADAILELYRLVDAGSPCTNQKYIRDFSKITGQKPSSIVTWIKKNVFVFQ